MTIESHAALQADVVVEPTSIQALVLDPVELSDEEFSAVAGGPRIYNG